MLYQTGSLARSESFAPNEVRSVTGLTNSMGKPISMHMTDMPENAAPGKKLSPAAKRALEEAAARRKAKATAETADRPPEKAGPKGAEPTRYGDWERGGIAYDF